MRLFAGVRPRSERLTASCITRIRPGSEGFHHAMANVGTSPGILTALADGPHALWQHGEGLLRQIYGDRPDVAAWIAAVRGAVVQAKADRPAALKTLDAARLVAPDWFQQPDQIGYSFYIDRFAGTIQGTIARLDYLQSLGVTYVHPLPLMRPREGYNDGGFAVASYEDVDPRLGSNADLDALASALHERGMALCLDVVCNHAAREHDWAARARAGDKTYQDYFHIVRDPMEVREIERTLGQVFPDTAPRNFTFEPDLDGWVWTTFYPFQWDLNYANPAVFLEMLQVLLRLSNRGVDAFRMDSTPFLWKEKGTDCRGLPQTHLIVQAWRTFLALAAPGVLLQAEAIVVPQDSIAFFGVDAARGLESHLAYNNAAMSALWASLALVDARPLHKVIALQRERPAEGAWISYVRCHDDIIWAALEGVLDDASIAYVSQFYGGTLAESYSGGAVFQADGASAPSTNGMTSALVGLSRAATGLERDRAVSRHLLVHQVMLALDGLPTLWMGDEVGLANSGQAGADLDHPGDGRWLHRPHMDWSLTDADGEVEAQILSRLRHLIKVRGGHAAFHSAQAAEPVALDDHRVIAFRRGANTVCLANVSAETVVVGLAGHGPCLDLSTSEPLRAERISLAPYQVRWVVLEDPA
jgi:amylosucrase